MPQAVMFAIQALTALPGLVKAGIDITNMVTEATSKLELMQKEKRDPTVDEWNALNTQIANLRNQLHRDAPGT